MVNAPETKFPWSLFAAGKARYFYFKKLFIMQTNSSMKVFTFNPSNQQIRVEVINNEPWFVVKDVCNVLGIEKHRDAISRLDEDERGSVVVDTLGGIQQMGAINESGLYNLVFQSRKPEAKTFRKWVTSEVLPSIRRTGSYEIKPVRKEPNLLPRRKNSRREGFGLETLRMLWLIDSKLNQGDQTQVALELGVSLTAVNQVLRGTLRSSRILWALYLRALENSQSTENIYTNPEQVILKLQQKNK